MRRRPRRLLIASVAAALVPALALTGFFVLLRPPAEPFDPVTWVPQEPAEVSSQLPIGADVRPLTGEAVNGPEDIAVDPADRLYISTRDGVILRYDPESSGMETFAYVGGRPLGLEFAGSGELLVANQGIGLQAVDPEGRVRLLADTAAGDPIRSANDLAIASDGTVYLTDSTWKHTPLTLGERTSYSLYDVLEGRPRGRVLAYDPVSGRTRVVADDLYFPNGIVLSADESSVLVAETTRYRITRLRIDDERRGDREVLVDDVPGLSDGLTRDDQGRLILATYQRVPVLDEIILPSVIAREAAVRLPEDLLTGDPLPGALLELSEDGEILRSYTGLDPAATTITPWRGTWVLGALLDQPLRVVDVPR